MQRNWSKWFAAAGLRAVRTFAQMVVSMITVGQVFSEINWIQVLSVSAVAAIYSLAMSLTGLPEIGEENILLKKPEPEEDATPIEDDLEYHIDREEIE